MSVKNANKHKGVKYSNLQIFINMLFFMMVNNNQIKELIIRFNY
jgi:hypothetical protein